jgi:hypothetical protein
LPLPVQKNHYGSDSDIEFIFDNVPPEIMATDKKRKGRSPVDIDDYDSDDDTMYVKKRTVVNNKHPVVTPKKK